MYKIRKGSALLIMVIVAAAIAGMVALGITKVMHMEYSASNNSSDRIRAQNYAVSEAEYIRAVKYHDLSLLTYGTKLQISDTDFYKELNITAEEAYTDNVKKRTVTVNIYKGSSSANPMFIIKVARYYNGTGVTNSANT